MHAADLHCAWGFYCGETMRDGYILLHRQGLTPEEWKNPRRTLAWFDFITLANFEDSIVTASYGFLANRWRVSKNTVSLWIRYWITERQIERQTERSTERNAERWFVVNYAKYNPTTERKGERQTERSTERKTEQRNQVRSNKSRESNTVYVDGADAPTPAQEAEMFFEGQEGKEKTIQLFIERGANEQQVRLEMAKFVSYWTEPNKTGTKVRWQTEKHFDVKRRLVTWFSRVGGRNVSAARPHFSAD